MKGFKFFDMLLVILMVFLLSLTMLLCINNNRLKNEKQRLKKQNRVEMSKSLNKKGKLISITYELPSIYDNEVVYVLNRPLPTMENR